MSIGDPVPPFPVYDVSACINGQLYRQKVISLEQLKELKKGPVPLYARQWVDWILVGRWEPDPRFYLILTDAPEYFDKSEKG